MNDKVDVTIRNCDPEYEIMGLEEDLNSLLHASMKAAIRNADVRLMDYINLNYNPFVLKHYPFHHRSIREIVREE